MYSRRDLVDFIKTKVSEAYVPIGPEKLEAWIRGEIYGIEDKWFAIFQNEGGSLCLENLILFYLNLRSHGYDDFKDKKRIMRDLYDSYVIIAHEVLKQSQDQLVDMQEKLRNMKDHDKAKILNTQIEVQKSVMISQMANVQTWENTRRVAILDGIIEGPLP